jgi:5-methylcytosine-specific restriction endonuclease McrA
MARAALRRRLLEAVRTDMEARLEAAGWVTRCLHCRSRVGVSPEGDPWPGTSLEHVVPRSWFGIREAAVLTADLEGPDDPRNLALACVRCNQQKGKGPDAAGPGDARAREVVTRLAAARGTRFKPS